MTKSELVRFIQKKIVQAGSRTTLYLISEDFQSEIFVDPPDQFAGGYIEIKTSNEKAFIPLHSEFKLEKAEDNRYAIIVFESVYDAPERRVWRGENKVFAMPHPEAGLL